VTVVNIQQLVLNSPQRVDLAIPDLKVIEAQECLQCGFIGGTEGSIREHCKQNHKWRRQDELAWKACHAQSFFSSLNRKSKYFKVLSPDTQVGDLNKASLMENLLTKIAEINLERTRRQSGLVTLQQQRPQDQTTWIRRTEWPKEFMNRDMGVITERMNKPTKKEPDLLVIWDSTVKCIEECVKGVKDLEDRG
jgi:hypothetical protein